MRYTYFLLLAVILFVGCKEDKITESVVSMKINFVYGSEPLAYHQEYLYETDKKIKLELVKFYISKPAFRNESGNWIPTPTEYFLVELDKPIMDLGTIPAAKYSAFRFGVGVDNSRNVETDPEAIMPTDYPNDHPLNFAADMWWGWSSGYIFSKIEGRIDVNNNGSYVDMEDKTISYHPGVADLYRSVELNKTYDIKDEIQQLEITLDMVKLFQGVKFVQYPVAHPNGTASPEYNSAKILMDNFPYSFE